LPSAHVIQHGIKPGRFRKELEETALIGSLPSCMIRQLKRHRAEMSDSVIVYETELSF